MEVDTKAPPRHPVAVASGPGLLCVVPLMVCLAEVNVGAVQTWWWLSPMLGHLQGGHTGSWDATCFRVHSEPAEGPSRRVGTIPLVSLCLVPEPGRYLTMGAVCRLTWHC